MTCLAFLRNYYLASLQFKNELCHSLLVHAAFLKPPPYAQCATFHYNQTVALFKVLWQTMMSELLNKDVIQFLNITAFQLTNLLRFLPNNVMMGLDHLNLWGYFVFIIYVELLEYLVIRSDFFGAQPERQKRVMQTSTARDDEATRSEQLCIYNIHDFFSIFSLYYTSKHFVRRNTKIFSVPKTYVTLTKLR